MIPRWTSCSRASAYRSSVWRRSSSRSAPATVMTTEPALTALLQFGDGLFPAGGFAHSFGLETYAQQGRLRGAADLDALIAAHLEGAAGPADAVAVALAARAASSTDVAALVALDDRLDARPEERRV